MITDLLKTSGNQDAAPVGSVQCLIEDATYKMSNCARCSLFIIAAYSPRVETKVTVSVHSTRICTMLFSVASDFCFSLHAAFANR